MPPDSFELHGVDLPEAYDLTGEPLEVGNKVRLVSGGPDMAVVSVGPEVDGDTPRDCAVCQWFLPDHSAVKEWSFPVEVLRRV